MALITTLKAVHAPSRPVRLGCLGLASLVCTLALAQETPAPRPRIVDENGEARPAPPPPPKAKPLPEDPAPSAVPAAPKPGAPVAPKPQEPKAELRPTPPPAVTQPPAAPATAKLETRRATTADEDLFNYAYSLYKRDQPDSNQVGAEAFARYITNYPNGKRLDAALTLKGECHRRLQDLAAAQQCYMQVITKFKRGEFLAYSARQMGTLAFNNSQPEEAARFYDIAATNATKADEIVQSRYYHGLSLKRCGKLKEAAVAFAAAQKTTGLTTTVFQDQALLELARYQMDNKVPTAQAQFEILAKRASTPLVKAEAAYTVGSLMLENKQTTEALEQFTAVAKMAGAEKWSSLARAAQIRTYGAAGEHKKVTDAWTSLDLKEIPPEVRPSLLLSVGDAFRAQDVFGSAADVYSMLDKFFPEAPETSTAGYRRLLCLYKAKAPDVDGVAYSFIEKEKQRNPQSEQIDMAYLMRAEDAFEKQKWDQAAKSYAQIRPEKISKELRGSLWYRKGRAEAQNGNHQAAVDSLSRFLAAYPADPKAAEITFRRAMAYLEVKDVPNAIKDFDLVNELYPDAPVHEEAMRFSALMRGQNKDFEGMIQRFGEMLAKYPKSKYLGEANFWIGLGFWNLKRLEECLKPLNIAKDLYLEKREEAMHRRIMALAQLERIDDLQREVDEFTTAKHTTKINAEVLAYLGGKRYTEQNLDAAAKYLGMATTAPQVENLNPVVWYQLADALLYVQNYAGCAAAVDKFLAVTDKISSERRAKVLLLRGRANLNLQKLNAARADANSGIELHTDDVNESRLFYLRGDVEFAAKNFHEAKNNYNIVVTLGPFDEVAAEAYRKLIGILEELGEKDLANTKRAEYKQKYPNGPEAK